MDNSDNAKEYHDHIKQSYKDNERAFKRNLSILIGFAFIFFILILFPYNSILDKNDKIEKEIENITKNIQNVEELAKPYVKAESGIQNLKGQIDKFPTVLKEYIDNLSNSGNSMAQQSGTMVETYQACPQENQNETEYIRCNVVQKSLQLFKNYNETIFNDVIQSLYSIDKKDFETINITKLKSETHDLQYAFNNILVETPEISSFYPSKISVMEQLQTEVDNYWAEYNETIGDEIRMINSTSKELLNEKNILERDSKQLNNTKEEIKQRISDIEFPFGKIPIGINEAIYIFPISLAIGFVIAIYPLHSNLILRKEIFQSYKETDISQTVYNINNIPKVLPIWFDSLSPPYMQITKLIIMLLPFAVFIISWVVIENLWGNNQFNITDNPMFYDRDFNHNIYRIVYASSSIVFVYGYVKTIKDYKRHSIRKDDFTIQ